jgi:hypothetical protein
MNKSLFCSCPPACHAEALRKRVGGVGLAAAIARTLRTAKRLEKPRLEKQRLQKQRLQV